LVNPIETIFLGAFRDNAPNVVNAPRSS